MSLFKIYFCLGWNDSPQQTNRKRIFPERSQTNGETLSFLHLPYHRYDNS
jgi:hypothetical protein